MKLIKDVQAMNPLITFFILIVIWGFLYGVFGVILAPLMNTDDTMNLLMSRVWWGVSVIFFVIIVGWLLVKAQKQRQMGGY